MTADTDHVISQALAYASCGWPVFPCQPGGKHPATRHGFHDASTDPAVITRWWRLQPAANLAIVTGQPGPDVLDIDDRGAAGHGFGAFRQLVKAGQLREAGTVVVTPSGGLHLYFTGTAQPSARLAAHHLDFKARGGYVLAPPSQVNDALYLVISHRPAAGPLNWAACTGLLAPSPRRPAPPADPVRQAAGYDASRLVSWVSRLREGNRNAGLFWAACRALETGNPGLLGDLADAAAATGLDDQEIARTITSARRCKAAAGTGGQS